MSQAKTPEEKIVYAKYEIYKANESDRNMIDHYIKRNAGDIHLAFVKGATESSGAMVIPTDVFNKTATFLKKLNEGMLGDISPYIKQYLDCIQVRGHVLKNLL